VGEAGQTMDEVVTGIRGVTSLVGDISGASREQSEAIEQVNKALSQIDQATQHNVALAEETAAAAEALDSEASALVDSVSVFRLAGDAVPAALAPVVPRPWTRTASINITA
jgi:methyl-accepting chemotaxis protein